MRIIWSDDALDDVERIYLYIREHNPIAARQLAERLFTAAASIGFPPSGAAQLDGWLSRAGYRAPIRFGLSGPARGRAHRPRLARRTTARRLTERLVLLLSSDGESVDMLFGGCVFDRSFLT